MPSRHAHCRGDPIETEGTGVEMRVDIGEGLGGQSPVHEREHRILLETLPAKALHSQLHTILGGNLSKTLLRLSGIVCRAARRPHGVVRSSPRSESSCTWGRCIET